jgi:hypothetical protein
MVLAVLLVLAAGAATRGALLTDQSWTRLSGRPSEVDLECAGYDRDHWAVTLQGGIPFVSIQVPHERQDPLPFPVPKHADRGGDRHVLKLNGGWIVGFDAGEFGGGLWLTATGTHWQRLRPPADAPADPRDPFKAENVQGLAVVHGQPIVLMGLDHLTGRSGRVFTLVSRSGKWTLGAGSVFDSCPDAWQLVGDHLEVVTGGGLWIVRADGSATLAVPLNFGMSYPRSLAIAPDGQRYIGMRRYVLMLERAGGGWQETWYGPARCPHSRRNEQGECSCTRSPESREPSRHH